MDMYLKMKDNKPSDPRFTTNSAGNMDIPQRPAWMTGSPECDWPEDFGHENGQYFCKCITCSADFIGHKRRHICQRCELDYQKYVISMTPEDRAMHEKQREQAIREYVAEFCGRKPAKKFPCPAGVEDDCGYPACAHARQCEHSMQTPLHEVIQKELLPLLEYVENPKLYILQYEPDGDADPESWDAWARNRARFLRGKLKALSADTDTQRLDWLQANLKSPWAVYGTKYSQTTESVPRRTKEDVFEGWTLSDDPNKEPCPTIRGAIDQAMKQYGHQPDTQK